MTYPIRTLTGVTLTDLRPDGTTGAVTGPTGDTNGDSKLQNTETWTYTASYTVKQSDIDAGKPLREHGDRGQQRDSPYPTQR